jgi:ATP-dependent DNA helicase RecQ
MNKTNQDPIDIAGVAIKALESPVDRRPNISLRVDTFYTREEKHDAVLRRVEFADKPGIVYVATHRNAETIAADLQLAGVEAVSIMVG